MEILRSFWLVLMNSILDHQLLGSLGSEMGSVLPIHPISLNFWQYD